MMELFASTARGLTPMERRQWTAVAFTVVIYLIHCTFFSTWQIEDAAISYAYARNAAAGDGFVTNIGGEWVEGFSNPTWTLLLVVAQWIGLSPFAFGKVAGVFFGALTLPLSFLWARRLQSSEQSMWPVLTPLILATSNQFALWAAAGLENGLFFLLLSLGVVLIFSEGDQRRWGWSGIPLGLLAITRPEAPMYAGMIAVMGGYRAVRMGGIRWAWSFFVLSAGPFFAWHAWRYQHFAWEFPNTYYAKQPEAKFRPFGWNRRSWTYLRTWSLRSTHAFLLPIFALGQSGTTKRRASVALGLVAAVYIVGIPGLGWLRALVELPAEPVWLIKGRVFLWTFALLFFPLLGLFRARAVERSLTWILVACGLFFSVYTGGDWMKGYRWVSLVSVPLAVLLADGARTIALALPQLNPAKASFVLVLPALLGGIGQSIYFLFGIETTPFDVRRRVKYMQGVQERIDVPHVSLLEVDMGAHLYWSGFEMIDIAGLCNVPIAQHHYPTRFIDEYLHKERRPDFAHLHGSWAKKTRVKKRPWFNKEYIELPGFGHTFFEKFHIGSYMRRDLITEPAWTQSTAHSARFGRLELEGLEVTPVVSPGGSLHVELGWSFKRRPPSFRALVFLSQGDRVVVHELPPAYDWLPVTEWRRDEVIDGRYTVPLPEDLPTGLWDLGIVVLTEGADAQVLRANPAPDAPVYMAGEARWPGVVRVGTAAEVRAEADTVAEASIALSIADDCDAAAQRWHDARHFYAPTDPWRDENLERVATPLGECLSRRAIQEDNAESMREALQWAPRSEVVRRNGRQLADRWEALGNEALARGDEEAAHSGWTRAMRADPTRSWLRRRIEILRTKRLKLEKK